MTTKPVRTSQRLIAASLAAALVLLSAGPEAYAAGGRAVEVSGVHSVVTAPLTTSIANVPTLGTMTPGTQIPQLPTSNLGVSIPGAAAQSAGAAAQAATTAAGTISAPALQLSAPGAKATTGGSAPVAAPAAGEMDASALDAAATGIGASASGSRVANGSRIGKALSGIRSWLGGKKDADLKAASGAAVETMANGEASAEGHSSGLSKATPNSATTQSDNGSVPPAPPSNNGGNNDDGNGGGDKSWFGLGKAAAAFIGALLVMQVGVEALGASMPTLVQKAFGDFTVVAQLGIFSSVASITGRQLGPILVKKYGLRKVYLTSEILRLISISALCALLATGTMTLPLMMGMYCINGMLGGVALTAESSIPPALIGQDQKKIERFWTVEQTLLEIVGVTGPIVTGMVVASMGFLPALIAYPISFAIAIAIMLKTLRIPQKVEAMRLADLAKAQAEGKMSFGGAFKEFFRKIGHGAKMVWNNPSLKYPFLGYTAYMALNPFLYSMLAPAYALRLVGNPEAATSVSGWLTGLYSLGGLLGGLVMMWESKKLEKSKPTPEQEEAMLRKSMLKWMMWGTVGLVAIGTLAFPSPMFLGTLTLPALALIPFGIAQVITTIKLKSFFQAKAPQAEMADAMGFFGAASLAVSTIGLLILKYTFKHAEGFTPFWYIAGAMIPLAVLYVWLTRQMANVSKPADKK